MKKQYEVVTPMHLGSENGVPIKAPVGAIIELDDADAGGLLQCGAVSLYVGEKNRVFVATPADAAPADATPADAAPVAKSKK